MVEKIILDTDIGSDVDDALALLYGIKSDNLDITAVTTVYGNVELRSKISRKILDLAKESTPVYNGESIPLLSAYRNIWHTGVEGKGILNYSEIESDYSTMGIHPNAVEYLIEKLSSTAKEINLVSIGALTNIAKALQLKPEILIHIYLIISLFLIIIQQLYYILSILFHKLHSQLHHHQLPFHIL